MTTLANPTAADKGRRTRELNELLRGAGIRYPNAVTNAVAGGRLDTMVVLTDDDATRAAVALRDDWLTESRSTGNGCQVINIRRRPAMPADEAELAIRQRELELGATLDSADLVVRCLAELPDWLERWRQETNPELKGRYSGGVYRTASLLKRTTLDHAQEAVADAALEELEVARDRRKAEGFVEDLEAIGVDVALPPAEVTRLLVELYASRRAQA